MSYQIVRKELAKLLRTSRTLRDESMKSVETRLAKSLANHPESHVVEIITPRFKALESEGDGTIGLDANDLRLLADVYGISALMLESLRSKAVETGCLLQSLDDFILPVTQSFGKDADYRIAPKKLNGTEDVHIVHLTLESGGSSDIHAHPGDEFLFVRDRGSVEIHLENNGLLGRLDRGDYIHFYAEQVHKLVNVSDQPADIFIIRFYQFETSGVRFKTLRELQKPKPGKDLIRRVLSEMKATLRFDMRAPHEAADAVVDRFGLGRLLQVLCGEAFRGYGKKLTLSRLANRGFTKAKLGRLHLGVAPVLKDQLGDLAEMYEVAPLLFYDYLFPALRNAIVVHQPDDWQPIPSEFLEDSAANYYVPCRRLAESDIAIALIDLPPNSETPSNAHPGFELLLPLEGRVELRLPDQTISVDNAEHLYAHFASSRAHRVANVTEQPAKILAIRFYQ